MTKSKITWLFLCIVVVILHGCSNDTTDTNADTRFAKSALEMLVSNAPDANSIIDWDTFYLRGQDVGAIYVGMTSEQKVSFQKSYLSQLSDSFNQNGIKTSTLTNWRIQSKTSKLTVVAVDTQNKATLLIGITEQEPTRKILSIDIAE